eukprot:14146315-Ditylum_brightwellii.AAC.1
MKDVGRTWWEHLASGLEVYVDDCLLFGNSKDDMGKVVEELRKKFDITDEGITVEEYLGVNIDHNKDGNIRM